MQNHLFPAFIIVCPLKLNNDSIAIKVFDLFQNLLNKKYDKKYSLYIISSYHPNNNLFKSLQQYQITNLPKLNNKQYEYI